MVAPVVYVVLQYVVVQLPVYGGLHTHGPVPLTAALFTGHCSVQKGSATPVKAVTRRGQSHAQLGTDTLTPLFVPSSICWSGQAFGVPPLQRDSSHAGPPYAQVDLNCGMPHWHVPSALSMPPRSLRQRDAMHLGPVARPVHSQVGGAPVLVQFTPSNGTSVHDSWPLPAPPQSTSLHLRPLNGVEHPVQRDTLASHDPPCAHVRLEQSSSASQSGVLHVHSAIHVVTSVIALVVLL